MISAADAILFGMLLGAARLFYLVVRRAVRGKRESYRARYRRAAR